MLALIAQKAGPCMQLICLSLFVIERDAMNLFRRLLEARESGLLEAAFYGFLLVVLRHKPHALLIAETVGFDVLLDYSLNAVLEKGYHSISLLHEFLFNFKALPDKMTFMLLRENEEVHKNLVKCLTCDAEFMSDRLCPDPSFDCMIDVSDDQDFRDGFLADLAVVDSFVCFLFDAGRSILTSDFRIDAINHIPEFDETSCNYFNRTVFWPSARRSLQSMFLCIMRHGHRIRARFVGVAWL
jgi:hypothetical protein